MANDRTGQREADAVDSHVAAIRRFDQADVARKYPARFGTSRKDRREVRNIRRALAGIPRGAHVLDLPCGTGRLLEILLDSGFRATCADCSEHMVRLARRRWEEIRGETRADGSEPSFVVRDVMQTGFPDGHFDAVVCNRLFHHFLESDTRIRALSELRRISKGPVVVSFFNAFAIDALRFRIKHALRGTVPTDRVPIPAWTFFNDLRRSGLEPTYASGVLWGVSPLWHVVGMPMSQRAGDFANFRPIVRSKVG